MNFTEKEYKLAADRMVTHMVSIFHRGSNLAPFTDLTDRVAAKIIAHRHQVREAAVLSVLKAYRETCEEPEFLQACAQTMIRHPLLGEQLVAAFLDDEYFSVLMGISVAMLHSKET